MAEAIINPQQVNRLVRNEPEKALVSMHKWDEFVRTHLSLIPELGTLLRQRNPNQIKNAWDEIVKNRKKDLHLDKSYKVIDGALIRLYWPDTPVSTEIRSQQLTQELSKSRMGQGIGTALGKGIVTPLAFIKPNPELLEQDLEYQKIRNQLETEWNDKKAAWIEQWKQENNVIAPDPNSETAHGEYIEKVNNAIETESPYSKTHELNYFYGTIDRPNISSQTKLYTIDDDSLEIYAGRVQEAQKTVDRIDPKTKNNQERKQLRQAKKLLGNFTYYQRIEAKPYGNPSRDPGVTKATEQFDTHVSVRLQYQYVLALQQNPDLSYNTFLQQNTELVQDLILKIHQTEKQRFENFLSKKKFPDPKQNPEEIRLKYRKSYDKHALNTITRYFPSFAEQSIAQPKDEYSYENERIRDGFVPMPEEEPESEKYKMHAGRGPSFKNITRFRNFFSDWETNGPGQAFKNLFSDMNPLKMFQGEGAGNFLQGLGDIGKGALEGAKGLVDTGIKGITNIGDFFGGLGGGGAATTAGETAALETALLPEEAAAAGAGGGGLLTILITILPFLIFFICIIVFIFLLWFLFSHPNYPVYVQVACSEEPGVTDAKGIGLSIARDFGISIEVNGNAATQLDNYTANLPEIMAVEKRIYDDLCRLYGHAIGANGKPFQRTSNGTSTVLGSDNTLGNLFRGFDHYYDSTGLGAGGHVTNLINLWIKSPDPNISKKTPCTAEFWPIGKSYDMDLWMYQPDQCLANQTDQTNLNVSDYAMEFLLDKYLGLKLIDRVQDELKNHSNPGDPYSQYVKNYKVYDNFLSTVYKNGTSLLPNPECQTPGNDQPKNCFAVMIADYTTWGVYANFQLGCVPGQVGGDAKKTADLASQLVNTIGKPQGGGGCGGTVNTGNYSCLYNLNPVPNPGGTAVEERLHLNTQENGILECAGFAQAVAIGIGKPIGDGNASSYIGRNNNDYTYMPNDGKNTIQVGDYPVWTKWAGQFPICQHIAVVVPFPNGQPPGLTRFHTAAANVNGQGDLIFFNYSVNDTFCTLQGWLRLKNAGSPTSSCPVGGNASDRIKPINSGDPNQYPHQPKSWMYSSCSGCSFAEVMNAYGKSLTCGDVLQYESDKGYWDPGQGFHGWNVAGIKDIAGHFGFNAVAGQGDKTLDQIIAIANGGQPVVVGLGGHILVIKGGNQNNVVLVDSLTGTIHTDSRSVFLNGGVDGDPNFKWDGTYAILTPK